MEFKIIEHFEKGEGVNGDYDQVTVHVKSGDVWVKKATYGDYYHDKGCQRALGFIDGYASANRVQPSYVREYIDDYEV